MKRDMQMTLEIFDRWRPSSICQNNDLILKVDLLKLSVHHVLLLQVIHRKVLIHAVLNGREGVNNKYSIMSQST